jgi:hypothetical protein
LQYQHWAVDDWEKVVWSDETKVCLQGLGGREVVWQEPGSALTEQQVQGTLRFGGGSPMMWGCMTAQGVGYACRIMGGLDAELYTHILNDEFLATLRDYGLEKGKAITFSTTTTPSTPPASRVNGSKATRSRC